MPTQPDPSHLLLILPVLATIGVLTWRWRGRRAWRRGGLVLLSATLLAAGYLLVQTPAVRPLLLGAAVLLGAYSALQYCELLVWEALLTRGLSRPLPRLLINIFNAVVMAAVMLGVLKALGAIQSLSAVAVTSTLASAIIGLALQDVLKNVVAGLALQIEPPFEPRDWVQIGDYEGRVVQINWRTVTIETRTHNQVEMPNTEVTSAYVVNYSRPDPLQGIDVFVDVAEIHPPGQVKAVLTRAVAEAPGVEAQPAPRVYLHQFGDSAITYRLRFWLTDFANLPTYQDHVLSNCWYELRRAGFAMPTLTRDIRLFPFDPDKATAEADQTRQTIHDTLRPLPLLAPLSAAQLKRVANRAQLAAYTAEERLVRAGEAGDSLFVIRHGHVRVEVIGEDGRAVTVANRGPGEFFGEMSLLTGAPRSATVVADAETEVVVVDRAAVAEVLLADPRVAEGLSETLAARVAETEEQLSAAAAEAEATRGQLKHSLLERIRTIFELSE